jgi:hypothetical protein
VYDHIAGARLINEDVNGGVSALDIAADPDTGFQSNNKCHFGRDMCLLGERGSGKSALIRLFAHRLGT